MTDHPNIYTPESKNKLDFEMSDEEIITFEIKFEEVLRFFKSRNMSLEKFAFKEAVITS